MGLTVSCKGSEEAPHAGRLLLARSVALALEAGRDETWIEISRVGAWKGHYVGEFELTLAHFESALAQFTAQTNEIAIDYEHASLGLAAEGAPAAGWIRELKIEGESLLALARFNARAAGYIRAGEYRYISPVWLFESPDRESGEPVLAELHSVALTNVPFFDGMAPVELTRLRALTRGEGMPGTNTNTNTNTPGAGGEAPVEGATPAGEAALAALLSLTGLKSEDELAAWVESNQTGLQALVDQGGEGAGEDGDGGAGMPATRTGGDNALTLAMSRIERLEQEVGGYRDQEIGRAVDEVIASGRATPAEREHLVELARSNRDLFNKITASRIASVPTQQVTSPATAANRTTGGKGAAPKSATDRQAEIDALSEGERFAFRNWRSLGKPHDEAIQLCREAS